jgi:hypothetical protein
VDREAIARTVRGRQVREALEFEREREESLKEQIELTITEAESARVDAKAFARMAAADVQLVREHFYPEHLAGDEGFDFWGVDRDDLTDEGFGGLVDAHTEELARLNEELESCRRLQHALTAYLEALEA